MAAYAGFLSMLQNMVPRHGTATTVSTADGAELRVAYWLATKSPCLGTICLLQGRAEFIEKHFEVIRDLRRRGFAVVTFDWRGQGRSSRDVGNPRKGHIYDFSLFHRDMQAIAEHILSQMPQPHFGLAYSMGGAIALDMACRNILPFQRLVLVSPMLKIHFVKTPWLAEGLASFLSVLGLSRSFIPFGKESSISTKPFPNNRLSSDPVRYGKASQTASAMGAGAIGAPTIGWTRAAFRLMKRLERPDVLHGCKTPCLILAAGSDTICDTRASERAAAHLKYGTTISIPESRHEMLLERDPIRKQFWSAFDAFIPGGTSRSPTTE